MFYVFGPRGLLLAVVDCSTYVSLTNIFETKLPSIWYMLGTCFHLIMMNNQPWGKGHKVWILYYGSEGNKNSGFESFDFLKGTEFEKEYLCVSNIFSYVYFSQNFKLVSRWCDLTLRK